MKRTAGVGNRRRSALAGIASFFRQLSLFDPVPPEEHAPRRTTDVTAPKAIPSRPAAPLDSRTALSPPPLPSAAEAIGKPEAVPSFAELCRGPYAHIEVVTRKRLWESWRVAWTRRNEALRLDIPFILEDAPRPVKESVLEWAVLVTRRGGRRDPILRARRSDLEVLIREHLRAPAPGETRGSKAAEVRLERNRRRLGNLSPKGLHHDLDDSFRAVNARYFEGRLEAKLTWSSRKGGLSTHSVAQDGEGKSYHLISISRGYDSPEVTPEILGGVVYHECLHIAIPPRREGGRRVVHGPDFRRKEREYEHFEIWRRWHRDGLPKAVRRLQRG
ncbi:MAG: hypothetical protein JWP91_3512 [Fibrobacteres bacterium]|nr:hypothetical protein [Fibrobacterota bacterium]